MSDAIMSDLPLIRRPAIAADAPYHFGSLTLEHIVDGSVLQLLGKPGVFSEADAKGALTSDGSASLRPAGPGQWFLVSDRAADIDGIARSLADKAYVVDQTCGRSRIRLSGPAVRQSLAKGTGVDLHPDQFPVGHATMTLIGHIGVNLARTGEDTFELLVLRGFAESLWHELKVMSAEFA
ncbi:sarcosine oxidase subunit gamma [Rhizobium sp. S-51]|uniref:Sarcosine oxidase subunit gamma n=1 Tax=Rhizobium terricola TaxID=2728849 RepID=A0A7Y0FXN6_9HYPH|nr:sarcosine oxidase subunit gamma family protein [Rhizobium terricola]NML76753.1 sarcosine oxidase subunit gamma [Rhizobium terricola]